MVGSRSISRTYSATRTPRGTLPGPSPWPASKIVVGWRCSETTDRSLCCYSMTRMQLAAGSMSFRRNDSTKKHEQVVFSGCGCPWTRNIGRIPLPIASSGLSIAEDGDIVVELQIVLNDITRCL